MNLKRCYAPLSALRTPLRSDVHAVMEFLREAEDGKTCVLTGAGVSTESGIPDYRSPQGSYSRGHKPMTHTEFTRSHDNRKRYWARAIVAEKFFKDATPNDGHLALAKLQQGGFLNSGIITQNVDRLLQKAGAREVLELHGNAADVACLSCGRVSSRREFHRIIRDRNADWFKKNMPLSGNNAELHADGDAEINTDSLQYFSVPCCDNCNGTIMPTIVFFGGIVSNEIRSKATQMINDCNRLLVVGSSLSVWSSFRLVRAAKAKETPIFIINIDKTRADDLATFKINNVIAGPLLNAVSEELC